VVEHPGGFSIAEASPMRARLLGLAGMRELPPEWGLHIPRCRSVHTFGMRFAVDLIFLARTGTPVRVVRDVKPMRLVLCARASSVIELSADQADRYLACWDAPLGGGHERETGDHDHRGD